MFDSVEVADKVEKTVNQQIMDGFTVKVISGSVMSCLRDGRTCFEGV